VKLKHLALGAMALVGATVAATPTAVSATRTTAKVPHYDHIVEIMMENQKYDTIIGNPLAPQLNTLAHKYGLATNASAPRPEPIRSATPSTSTSGRPSSPRHASSGRAR